MFDCRLLDGEVDRSESIPDLANPFILTESGEGGGYRLVEGRRRHLDGLLDPVHVRY